MAEEYVLPAPEKLTIRIEDADKLLTGSGDAALLYLYILRSGGRLDPEAAARSLKLRAPLRGCMEELRRLGLVRAAPEAPAAPKASEQPPAARRLLEREDAPPEYTIEDIRRCAGEGSEFSVLLNEVAVRLGRVLSGGDMTILFGVYDYLGLPPEVILLLIGWCVREQERRYGAGKKPSLRQIEKEAFLWAKSEIYSLDEAERFLRRREERRQRSGEVRRLLGIRERPLSPTEEKYILSWLEMGFESEAILRAYDRTVLNKKELVWPYMNRILESWHEKGLHSVAEIEAMDARTAPDRRKGARRQQPGLQQPEQPAPDEYARMQRYLNKLNGGDEHGT